MSEQMRYREPQVWKGALAGAIAGLAASWVMTRFQVTLSGRGETDSENPQSNKPVEPSAEGSHAATRAPAKDDVAMKTANEASKLMLGRELTRREKTEVGGPLAHYLFGISAGAIYGMLKETEHAPGGAAFGAELWAVADQIGLPMAGLSPWPLAAYPPMTNAQHFMAHVVYGLSTAGVYTVVRRAL
jgi:putative membrane protein